MHAAVVGLATTGLSIPWIDVGPGLCVGGACGLAFWAERERRRARAAEAAERAQREVDRAELERISRASLESADLLDATVRRLQVLTRIQRDLAEQALDFQRVCDVLALRLVEALGGAAGVYGAEGLPALRAFQARPDHQALRAFFDAAGGEPTVVKLANAAGALKHLHDLRASAEDLATSVEVKALATLESAAGAIAIPMVASTGERLATLLLVRSGAGAFEQLELELVEQVADRAAASLETAKLHQARDAFIAVAAHELRTPIAALRAHTQLALRRQGAPEKLKATVENIERQSARVARLVDDLLDVTRIETAKLDLRTTEVDGGAIASELVDRFAQLTGRAAFVRAGERAAWVKADPVRLEQVLSNLLQNAAKFCPEGDIQLRVARHRNEVQFSVVDRGEGIPRDEQVRLFQRYAQAHNGEKRGGLGLGLYLSRELVTRMGGRIWAESEGSGKGSAFHVVLPAAETESARNL